MENFNLNKGMSAGKKEISPNKPKDVWERIIAGAIDNIRTQSPELYKNNGQEKIEKITRDFLRKSIPLWEQQLASAQDIEKAEEVRSQQLAEKVKDDLLH